MKKRFVTIVLVVIALAAAAGAYYYFTKPNPAKPSPPSADEVQQVRDVVTHFGKQLQNVPLSASPDLITSAIDENYKPYVSAALLAQWESDPSSAPGRLTSSPWPDRIDIASVTKSGEEFYEVKGTVIELTSQEVAHGGVAASYPVTIEVSRDRDSGNWVIANFQQAAAQ